MTIAVGMLDVICERAENTRIEDHLTGDIHVYKSISMTVSDDKMRGMEWEQGVGRGFMELVCYVWIDPVTITSPQSSSFRLSLKT